MRNKVRFEYFDQDGATPFETFLKYTNEKEKSAEMLAKILEPLLAREGTKKFLDIGAGNGEFLELVLNKMQEVGNINFTLLEPGYDSSERLRVTIGRQPLIRTAKIVNTTFDDFREGNEKNMFDVVLASHLPLAKETLPITLGNMLELVGEVGRLIVVLRGEDDVYEFRTRFKPLLNERKDYRALTINDALDVLNSFAGNWPLRISQFSAFSELHMPLEKNMMDTIAIIEFYLNEKWDRFPDDVRKEILVYLKQKDGILHQIDGFAVVDKTSDSK